MSSSNKNKEPPKAANDIMEKQDDQREQVLRLVLGDSGHESRAGSDGSVEDRGQQGIGDADKASHTKSVDDGSKAKKTKKNPELTQLNKEDVKPNKEQDNTESSTTIDESDKPEFEWMIATKTKNDMKVQKPTFVAYLPPQLDTEILEVDMAIEKTRLEGQPNVDQSELIDEDEILAKTVATTTSLNRNATQRSQSEPGAYACALVPDRHPATIPRPQNQSSSISSSSASDTSGDDDEEAQQQAAAPTLIEAVEVQDERAQMEANIRQSILQEAVQASVLPDKNSQKKALILCGILALVIIVLGLGLGLGLSRAEVEDQEPRSINVQPTPQSSPAPARQPDNRPTLEVVKERGYVKCGVNQFAFSKFTDETETEMEGFNVEQCRAIALLSLGNSSAYQLEWASPKERFQLLANRSIDALVQGTTFTMGRDVYEERGNTGFTFTNPYFYSGLTFSGVADFVDCAEVLDDFHGICRDLQICVADGSTHLESLNEILRGSVLVPSQGSSGMKDNLLSGKCNVIASEPMFSVRVKAEYPNPEEYKMGQRVFSKEPLSLVTRQDDSEWSTLVSLAVEAFLTAEAHILTHDNASENFLNLLGDDSDLASFLVDLVSEFGHHGDLYRTQIEKYIPRGNGLNSVYRQDDTSGLLYAIPFGNIQAMGPGPVPDGTLEAALDRGYLVCGILPTSRGPGFAESINGTWTGLDTDFCRALAAALFVGDDSKVEFVPLDHPNDAYAVVTNGGVDVVAGARVSLQAMYKEPFTQQGFVFSSPYYYDNDTKDAYAFLTQPNDAQWSDFVYWIVQALVFAEEEGITAETSTEMPVVASFGQDLKQMLRDCVSAVGNYATLYNQSLQALVPRAGANRLNEDFAGPQLFPIPLQ